MQRVNDYRVISFNWIVLVALHAKLEWKTNFSPHHQYMIILYLSHRIYTGFSLASLDDRRWRHKTNERLYQVNLNTIFAYTPVPGIRHHKQPIPWPQYTRLLLLIRIRGFCTAALRQSLHFGQYSEIDTNLNSKVTGVERLASFCIRLWLNQFGTVDL